MWYRYVGDTAVFPGLHEKSTTHPSGPFWCFPDDVTWLFLIQVHVFVFAGIVDKDRQQDDGSVKEEVQWWMEVKKEQGEGRNQDRGDLARQHVEHVVSEFQDESHRQT